ncbi:TPA: hypothetical protein ACHK2F_000783, partial [Escherichia coli]
NRQNQAVICCRFGSRPLQQIDLCCMSNAGASQQSNIRQQLSFCQAKESNYCLFSVLSTPALSAVSQTGAGFRKGCSVAVNAGVSQRLLSRQYRQWCCRDAVFAWTAQ